MNNSQLGQLAKKYEELRHFPSQVDAETAYKDWKRLQARRPTFWLGLIGYTVFVGVVMTSLLHFIQQWIAIPGSIYGGVVGGIVGGSAVGTMTWIWRRRFRSFLRTRLASFGIPVCIQCGYDLRRQERPRCPECGTTFDPALLGEQHERLA